VEGDTFSLRVLDEQLYYQVDRILVVEPDETDELRIVEGEDYCTLMTCTPYGVNSHRLLVRGHRIDAPEDSAPRQPSANPVQQSAEDSAPRLTVIGLLTAAAFIETMIMIFSRKTRKKEAGK
jgi:sortase A